MSGLVEGKWILNNASAFSLLQYDVLEEKEAKEENSTSHRLVVRKERTWWTPWESLRDSPAVLGPRCPKSGLFPAGDFKCLESREYFFIQRVTES